MDLNINIKFRYYKTQRKTKSGMKSLTAFLNKEWKINSALFLFSFAIYFFYFHHIFLNLNSILSSVTLDSLKNYYTFVYHIKNDSQALHFSGMNYPFGEHITYTDCQPIITWALRLFPFTHGYLIGIMHFLMFFSFVITPVILNRIFRLFDLDSFSSFLISLSIALLSPQFVKINGGHFALAYGCIIPVSILLTLRVLKGATTKRIITLSVYNTLLFFLHPYLGFCLSLLSFMSILFLGLVNLRDKHFLKSLVFSGITGILPIILFKLFMFLTDTHLNRTVEPFGAEMMVENLASILSPEFGPFRRPMEFLFPQRAFHFEGHTYLGFTTILLAFLFIVTLPLSLKKLRLRKEISVILIASFLFLLISFGIHLKVFALFNLQSAALNQFRAVCRFAWIFYFTLPVFLVVSFYHLLKDHLSLHAFKTILPAGCLIFFSFNLVEAHYFLKHNDSVFWKYRNFFNEGLLNSEEKINIENLRHHAPQAILPLPIFMGGSEIYDRPGSNNSMIPSMIYSYHTGLPILSALLSRTSITETEDVIQVLNSYRKHNNLADKLGPGDLFVITTADPLMPDEKRLLKSVNNFGENDTLKFGYLSKKDLFKRKLEPPVLTLGPESRSATDSTHVIYVPYENRKPFTTANILDYEKIFVLDSNTISSGFYVLSFHYHYTLKTFRSLACDLIVTRTDKTSSEWQFMIPVRNLSGFYEGFGVFEYDVALDQRNNYEFMIKGHIDQSYRVSDFLLRPAKQTVLIIGTQKDTLFNNYPGQAKR